MTVHKQGQKLKPCQEGSAQNLTCCESPCAPVPLLGLPCPYSASPGIPAAASPGHVDQRWTWPQQALSNKTKGIAPSCNAYHDWHGKKWPAPGLDQEATNQSQLHVDTGRKSALNVKVTTTIAASDMVCAT